MHVDDDVEEEFEIDINDEEPEFLKGQSAKSGVEVSPVKIVANPDGSLQVRHSICVRHAAHAHVVSSRRCMDLLSHERYCRVTHLKPRQQLALASLKGSALILFHENRVPCRATCVTMSAGAERRLWACRGRP